MTEKRELRLIKTLWGIDDPLSPELLKSIKQEGYHGIEVIRLAWLFDKDLLVQSLNEAGLAVVCQIHTSGGYLKDNEYIYCGAYDVALHQEDFKKQLLECKELIGMVEKGGFINVHAGVDAWSKTEALEFLEYCLKEIEQSVPDTTVTFETHRQRLFGSPFQTRELLSSSSSSLAKLKLNADLSHWYCACERVFNPKEEDRDKTWWPEVVKTIAGHCEYIHARLGWAQGPQMADPSAKECEAERTLQVDVWKQLMQAQLSRDPPTLSIYASPEFGPPPYMPVKPHSQEPVASLPDAVSYTKKLLEELFATL